MSQEILQSLEVMVGQLVDNFSQQITLLLDWLTGDLQHPVVETEGEQWVGQGAEEELNRRL